MLKSTNFLRSVQIARPNVPTIVTNTDILPGNVRSRALNELIPAIRQKSINAEIDRVPIRFYQQMFTGRMCSCWRKEQDAPEANCPICWGVGRVGGFNVHGMYVDVIDTTKPDMILLNIQINDEVWPWRFELVEGTLEGYIEAAIDVPSMIDVDVIKLYYTGYYVRTFVRCVNSATWHSISRSALISLSAISKKLVIRIYFSRKSTSDASPILTHLYLRYKFLEQPLYVDMPRLNAARMTENFDLVGLQTMQVFISSNLPSACAGDFFKDLRHSTSHVCYLWKIVEVQINDPFGILTSWDLNVRSIEPFEIYNQIP